MSKKCEYEYSNTQESLFSLDTHPRRKMVFVSLLILLALKLLIASATQVGTDVDVSSMHLCWSDCNSTSICEEFVNKTCGLSCGSFSSGLLTTYCDIIASSYTKSNDVQEDDAQEVEELESSSTSSDATSNEEDSGNCYDHCSLDCSLWFAGSCGQDCDSSTASYINKFCYFFGSQTNSMFPQNVTSLTIDYSSFVSSSDANSVTEEEVEEEDEEDEEDEEEEDEEEDDDDENDVDGYRVDDRYKRNYYAADGDDLTSTPSTPPTISPTNITTPPDDENTASGSMVGGLVMSAFFAVAILAAILLNNFWINTAKKQAEEKRASDVKSLVAGDDQELMEVGNGGGGGAVKNPVYFDGFTVVSAEDADSK